MRRFNDSKYQTMCILGSFNKHYDTIAETATYFKERGEWKKLVVDDHEMFNDVKMAFDVEI